MSASRRRVFRARTLSRLRRQGKKPLRDTFSTQHISTTLQTSAALGETQVPFAGYFVKSIFGSTAFTLLALFLGSLGGFGFAKYQFRGKSFLFLELLVTMMIPYHVALIPLYSLIARLGWIDSAAR